MKMYRSTAKRLPSDSHRRLNLHSRISHLRTIATSKSFSTSPTDNLSFNNAPNPNPNQHGNPSGPEPANDFLSGGKSSTARRGGKIYEDEQARVLRSSLSHVSRMGWTEAAMMVGTRDSGISPVIVRSFSRKEATLVEYLMDHCLQKLIDKIDSDESLKLQISSECIQNFLSSDWRCKYCI